MTLMPLLVDMQVVKDLCDVQGCKVEDAGLTASQASAMTDALKDSHDSTATVTRATIEQVRTDNI